MRDYIEEALWNMPKIDVPLSTLAKVDNVLADLENRKVEKNRMKLKSFAGIAAIVAIFALLCGTVLAATGIIDFGRFYGSIFSNPEASPYISTEDMISVIGSSEDLTIEPIAGFIGGEWNLYIQLKLTAKNNVPFPETLYILNGNQLVSIGDVVITEIDESTAIISFRTHDGRRNGNAETMRVIFNAVSSSPYAFDSSGNVETAPIIGADGTYEYAITYFGDWEVLVSANNLIETRFVEGSFEGRNATVRIEATTVEIQVFGNKDAPYLVDSSGWINYRYDPEGTMKITLADGRVIEETRISVSAGVGSNKNAVDEHGNRVYGMASYSCISIEFMNPADVISVELYGEQIFSPSGG